jgi:phospholipase/lecithinase/hemolysin
MQANTKINRFTIAATLTLVGAAPVQASGLDPFLVFGDSLSDAGYIGAQVTNGDTWAAQLGATTAPFAPSYNFAQLGARATSDNPISLPGGGVFEPEDFDAQIDRFQSVTPAITPGTWTVAWLGGNDFLNAAQDLVALGLDPSDPADQAAAFAFAQAAASETIGAITAGLTRLNAENALTRFIVPGLPDMGALPQFDDPTVAAFQPLVTLAAVEYNENLQLALENTPTLAGLTIEYYDVFSAFAEVVAGSPDNGFTNVTDACDENVAALLSNCAGYAFFDDIHPTDALHAVLSEDFAALLSQSTPVVPLPAGVWLLLTGAGALVLTRRAARQVAA